MIEYNFDFPNGDSRKLTVDLDRGFPAQRDEQPSAFWTALDFHQCANCPLKDSATRHCPPAVDIQELVLQFNQLPSFSQVLVRVITPQREYRKECDVQTGLNAILGLVMATSGCPILGRLKGMARFHLPFATTEETVYRVVGNYLVQQYFAYKDGLEPDLDLAGLDKLYQDLEVVNTAFAERIRAASEKDANINAVIRLSGLAFLVRSSLKKQLITHRANLVQEFV
jgi:hypothetical protein